MKKKILMFLLVSLVGAGSYVQAQDRDQINERIKAYSEKMTKNLAKELDLDKETEKWFVDLYQEYQDTLRAVRGPQRINEKVLKKMSDEQATQMVEDIFTLSEYRVALQRAYYVRFKEKLNAKQLVKIFLPNPRSFMMGNPGMSRSRNYPGGGSSRFGGMSGFGEDF